MADRVGQEPVGQEPVGQEPAAHWTGTAYARASGHHRAVDQWFLDRHPPAPTDDVVDVGCGSGEFTALMASLVPQGQVVGVDQDASMIEAARRHTAANLRFVQAPAQDVDAVLPPASADLVVSRAMLHWLPPDLHARLFQAVFTVLRPGGWLHLESAGLGNIPKLTALLDDVADAHALPRPPAFPHTGLVFEVVEAAGFAVPDAGVGTVAQRRSFTRDQLVALLRTQATLVLTRHVPDGDAAAAEAVVADAIAGVDRLRRHDGSFDQTFVRLDVLVQRPGGTDGRPGGQRPGAAGREDSGA